VQEDFCKISTKAVEIREHITEIALICNPRIENADRPFCKNSTTCILFVITTLGEDQVVENSHRLKKKKIFRIRVSVDV
jgi:hypothetical protein